MGDGAQSKRRAHRAADVRGSAPPGSDASQHLRQCRRTHPGKGSGRVRIQLHSAESHRRISPKMACETCRWHRGNLRSRHQGEICHSPGKRMDGPAEPPRHRRPHQCNRARMEVLQGRTLARRHLLLDRTGLPRRAQSHGVACHRLAVRHSRLLLLPQGRGLLPAVRLDIGSDGAHLRPHERRGLGIFQLRVGPPLCRRQVPGPQRDACRRPPCVESSGIRPEIQRSRLLRRQENRGRHLAGGRQRNVRIRLEDGPAPRRAGRDCAGHRFG